MAVSFNNEQTNYIHLVQAKTKHLISKIKSFYHLRLFKNHHHHPPYISIAHSYFVFIYIHRNNKSISLVFK